VTLAHDVQRRHRSAQHGVAVLLRDHPHLAATVDRVVPLDPKRHNALAATTAINRAILAVRVLNAHRELRLARHVFATDGTDPAVVARVAQITAWLRQLERDGRLPSLPWDTILAREDDLPARCPIDLLQARRQRRGT
jgi:hypothetical protein